MVYDKSDNDMPYTPTTPILGGHNPEPTSGPTIDPTKPEQSFGQRTVRAPFNPSGLPRVDKLKSLSAELIDYIDGLRIHARSGEELRCYSLAITHLETACMFAVKGATTDV